MASLISQEALAVELGIDLPPAPSWPLPRLMWFRNHEPATLEKASYLVQAKDFVNFRLTGEFASDASSNRGLVNFSTGREPEKLLRRLRLPVLGSQKVQVLFRRSQSGTVRLTVTSVTSTPPYGSTSRKPSPNTSNQTSRNGRPRLRRT